MGVLLLTDIPVPDVAANSATICSSGAREREGDRNGIRDE
jgi:hypothetical protein